MTETNGGREAEQIQIARAIGDELTGAFVGYVRGRVDFDALAFGVFDALSDLHAVASGEYELQSDDHDHHEHEHGYDASEATEEQEELAQEPVRDDEE